MITKMKKITLLVYHKEYDAFLHDLRELGLIHVAERTEKSDDSENEVLDNYLVKFKKLSEAKKTLQRYLDPKSDVPQNAADAARGRQIPAEIEAIENEKSILTQQLQVSRKERDALLPWGDFNPESIKKLHDATGYDIGFFVVQDSQFNPEWENSHNAIVVARQGGRTHFLTFTKGVDVVSDLSVEAVNLPDISLAKLDVLINTLDEKLRGEEQKLNTLALDLPSVQAALDELDSNITFAKVHQSAARVADDKLMLLQGWAPVSNADEISKYLESKDAYFQISDPTPDDNVPVLLKNNRFFRLFEPIGKLYMLPQYNEVDLTPYFAPFFMIFFGLSLGDIGYGLFLLLAATGYKIFARKTIKPEVSSILSLVQVLGASTLFCGLLTGGFFGIDLYKLNNPVSDALRNKLYFDNNQMFNLSLILGVVQVIFGMVVKVANRIIQFGFMHGLSTIGWIVLLLSIIVSVLFPVALPMFGTVHLVILGLCGILIFFFNSPGKNPLLNLGLGLWDTYNMATGLLGDILSYVRLFALGLSGGILASVFTSLATGMSPDNVVAGTIVTVIIFVAGHAINIFMNTLGAIVHPMRLTFVEFFKNSEFTGGGKQFKPFKN